MRSLLTLIRPYNWIKNFFIFVPLFFARQFLNSEKLTHVGLAFLVFCITASIVYIFNDICDREQDKKHNKKKHRPLASGALSLTHAVILLLSLFILDSILIWAFIPSIALMIGIYLALNLLYSLYLKHVAIIDILLISSFYFIRVIVGGIAGGIVLSHWLLLCVLFISLFLISGKRLAEFNQEEKRGVLETYSEQFLNAILLISATLSIISYSLYSVLVLNSNMGIVSIFFVLLGIMRYIFLVFTTDKGEYPEKAVISDGIVCTSALLWLLTMCIIFYIS